MLVRIPFELYIASLQLVIPDFHILQPLHFLALCFEYIGILLYGVFQFLDFAFSVLHVNRQRHDFLVFQLQTVQKVFVFDYQVLFRFEVGMVVHKKRAYEEKLDNYKN